jgi:hypothetical protein
MKSFKDYLSKKNVISQDIIEESRTEAERNLVEEAAFKAADINKVIKKVASVISKATGTKFASSPLPYYYKNKDGEQEGYYLFTKKGNAIRLNVGESKSKLNVKKEAGSEIISFDVFDIADAKGEKTKPTVTVKLNGLNIVQVIKELTDVITNPSANKKFKKEIELPNPNKRTKLPTKKVTEEGKTKSVLDINLIEEAKIQIGDDIYKSMGAAIEGLFKKGMTGPEIKKITGCSPAQLSQGLKKIEQLAEIEGVPGLAEGVGAKVIKMPEIPKKVPVDTLFKHLNSLVKMVLMGLQKGLIVSGQAGVGKCVGPKTNVKVNIKHK